MNSVYVVYEIVNQPFIPSPPFHPLPSYPQPFPFGSNGPQFSNPLQSIDFPSNPPSPPSHIPKPYTGPIIKIICVCKTSDTATYYCSQAPYRQVAGPINIIN